MSQILSMKQNGTGFEPNPKMLKLLEAAINPNVEASISAWCEEAGVARSQWYRWQEIPDFIGWFNSEYKKSFEGVRAALIKVGLQKALNGDFQFWKVLMEKMGEYGESLRLEGDLNTQKPTRDYSRLTIEELNTLIELEEKADPESEARRREIEKMTDEEINEFLIKDANENIKQKSMRR